ncbi:MAG: hypothetical protein M3364_01105 [Actinomycetota bacterium]|nr:hypothetical protein [Actinomycetota bacterium]
MAGAAGATTLWVWARESDQDENSYVVPFRIFGVVALIEFVGPTMTVRVNGVADAAPFSGS